MSNQSVSGNITTLESFHRTDVDIVATANGSSGILESAGMGCLSADLSITAVSGTTPALYVSIEISEDGVDWTILSSFIKCSTITGDRIGGIRLPAKFYRFVWSVTGTTPSFTFSIVSSLKSYLPARTGILRTYSSLDLTTVNNTSPVFTSANSRAISVQTVRAADGGNNGQWFVQASNDSQNWDQLTGNITQGAGTIITTDLSIYGVYYFYRFVVKSSTNAGTRVLDIHWSSQHG